MLDTYDFLILGGGAAGLSLAYRMTRDPFFENKRIGIVEMQNNRVNDRTWCYWAREEGMFGHLATQVFPELLFFDSKGKITLDSGDYRYYMIRGIDFYTEVYQQLNSSQIDIINDRVMGIDEKNKLAHVTLEKGGSISAKIVFKAYHNEDIKTSPNQYVDQHFKGWVIDCPKKTFNPKEAVLMDFRIDQANETRFMYVLPLDEKRALVEVAIFSNSILSQEAYDDILKNYIREYLSIDQYSIEETEFGIIPMTTYPFFEHNSDIVFGLGTAGGCVKASSGYAFQRIQEHSDRLIDCLISGKSPHVSYDVLKNRFRMYDKIFLNAVLSKVEGKEVFSRLFRKRDAHEIFKFLDEKTNLLEDISIFTAPPFFPFLTSIGAALKK